MRDRLIELLMKSEMFNDADGKADTNCLAEHLLANGVIVPPVNTGETVYSIALKRAQPFVVVEAHIHLVGKEAAFEYKAESGE